MVLDGQGNITSGEQTVNFNDPSTGAFVSKSGPIVSAGSRYFHGPDGRGTITINPSNPRNDPSIVPQPFSLVFLSNSHALITVTPTSALTVSASGTMDMQASSIIPLSGGYAFVVGGTDFSGDGPTAIGGVLNFDYQSNNPNNISGTGSVADQNLGGALLFQSKPFGNVLFPDRMGMVILTLNVPCSQPPSCGSPAIFSPTTGLPAQLSGSFNGNYSIAMGSGRGRTGFYGFASPNNLFQPIFIFYLTGNGSPALVLASGDINFNYPFLGTGIAYPQSNALTISGAYGLNFTQQNGTESDGTAVMTGAAPSVSGTADVGPTLDQAYTGTINAQSCSAVIAGCFSGSFANAAGSSAFQGSNASNPNSHASFHRDFYMIGQNHGFFIENDLLVQQQVSLGFFATQTAPQMPLSAILKCHSWAEGAGFAKIQTSTANVRDRTRRISPTPNSKRPAGC